MGDLLFPGGGALHSLATLRGQAALAQIDHCLTEETQLEAIGALADDLLESFLNDHRDKWRPESHLFLEQYILLHMAPWCLCEKTRTLFQSYTKEQS